MKMRYRRYTLSKSMGFEVIGILIFFFAKMRLIGPYVLESRGSNPAGRKDVVVRK